MAKGDDLGLERLKRIESGGHPGAILAEGMKLRIAFHAKRKFR